MSFYLDMGGVLEMFAVPLKVYVASDSGHFEDGRWMPGHSEPITVNEPFLPNTYSNMSGATALRQGIHGNITTYKMQWFSMGKYELGTRVEHNNVVYVVESKNDYTDYANVTQYFLDTEENHHKVVIDDG